MAILFANNAEALMGSTEDPPDGGAVARTCIGAVIVYSVLLQIPSSFNPLSLQPLSFFVVILGGGGGGSMLMTRSSLHSVDVKSSSIDGLEA
jgi:hypothetical protein